MGFYLILKDASSTSRRRNKVPILRNRDRKLWLFIEKKMSVFGDTSTRERMITFR